MEVLIGKSWEPHGKKTLPMEVFIIGKSWEKTTTHGSFPRKIKGKSWENIEHTTINIIHGGVQRKIIGEYGKKGKSWN